MKKAIVTGATGFLGSWLVKELSSSGIEVTAVVRSLHKEAEILAQLENVKIVKCQLSDMERLPEIIEERDIDVFYHLAWAGTSGMERADVRLQLQNVQASCDAVAAASAIGCRKYVNAGSIMEYEAMQYIPSDGSRPGRGSIYSSAKLAADYMSKTVAVSYNLSYINAIISNIYGPGEKSARFVNSTLRKLLSGERACFTHGEQLYDFIYASDAAKAFRLVGEKGEAFGSYYIGSKEPHPLKEFIIKMRDAVDDSIELFFGEVPFEGASLDYGWFDMQKLHAELGFVPETTFEQGIRNTSEWIKGGML